MNLSIVVINYNTKEITHDCIDSVIKNTKGINYEIILIDNASTDGSLPFFEKLKSKYKNLLLIKNKTNVGFCKANNQGIKISKGEYVLFLNSDTIIYDNTISDVFSWMKKNPNVGASSCALKNKDGSLQGTGGSFPTLFKVFSWMFFLEDIPFLDKIIKPFHPVHDQSPFYKGEKNVFYKRQQDWITGAFMIIPKKVINKVGLFCEDFFMYTEELEYCYRIRKMDYQVWYLPEWNIVHFGGASSTKEFPILSEYKGIKLFYMKHMPKWQYPVLRMFLKIGALLRASLFFFLKGTSVSKIYIKAYYNA